MRGSPHSPSTAKAVLAAALEREKASPSPSPEACLEILGNLAGLSQARSEALPLFQQGAELASTVKGLLDSASLQPSQCRTNLLALGREAWNTACRLHYHKQLREALVCMDYAISMCAVVSPPCS